MINAKEIIESGYLEAYVLGALNKQEQQTVTGWLRFPEVNDYIIEIQNLVETLASECELSPSEGIRNVILGKQITNEPS